MNIWPLIVTVLIALHTTECQEIGMTRIFCHPKFWDFSKCLIKEGGEHVRVTIEECSKKLIPDGNEKVFFRSFCNDTHNRNMYLRCSYEEIKKRGNFKLPTRCMKIVNMKPADHGKHVQSFFCGDPERLKCLQKYAPAEDHKQMDICRSKLFPEVSAKEFQTFMCEMTDNFDLKRLGDFKSCFVNHLKEAGRPVPPRYATECKMIEKGSMVKWWICAKPSRYTCLKTSLPGNSSAIVDGCRHEYFPKATDSNMTTFCADGDDVDEKVGRVTGCVVHTLRQTFKGTARFFITKC